MSVTIRDVARISGYSTATVSIVLNDAPLAANIPVKTKEHIRKVAQTLGYKPNLVARSLRTKRSHTVGVIVFDITDPYCTQILRGIENCLFQSTYIGVLTDIQNDYARFQAYLEMLLERRVEGLITLANSLKLKVDLLGMLHERGVPAVIIGRQLEPNSMSSVEVDNAAGARLGLKHLYELGHRQIAFIRGPQTLIDTQERWKGITGFADEVGLEVSFRLVMDIGAEEMPSHELGYDLTHRLLKRRIPFTALMAFDDMTAFGAIRALHHAGLRVPEDCSVVGFDDIATAAFYNPPLTTVRQPLEVLGSTGARILVQAMSARNAATPFKAVHRQVRPKLVVRQSTAPPRD